MNERIAKYWQLLNDAEDYLLGGYRTNHPDISLSEITHAASSDQNSSALRDIESKVLECTRCGLAADRKQAVPGTGVYDPKVVVIGEGPGAEEDRLGLPFVGPAGKYLDKWLGAIDLYRDKNCFIANIVKCRPPGNRDPAPEESSACLPYLIHQIELLKPSAILTVGRIAAQILLDSTKGIGAIRGRVYSYKGIPLVPTYHPSGVLRNPEYRRAVWDDLKVLKGLLDNG